MAQQDLPAGGDTWFVLMARYNRWMNEKLYAAAAGLDEDALNRDMGAYFGSVLGTLNHLATADIIWLRRFAGHEALAQALSLMREAPVPTRLDEVFFGELDALWQYRRQLDAAIIGFADVLGTLPPATVLEYTSMKGVPGRRNLQALAIHLFNHQTHHRGQVTTLLKQAGIDPGVTDLLALIPDLDSVD